MGQVILLNHTVRPKEFRMKTDAPSHRFSAAFLAFVLGVLASPVAFGASFSSAGSPTTLRASHTATLLPNGKVLVAGGNYGSTNLSSAEFYNPVSNTWSAAGSLATGRYNHTATLLPSGKILVVGGFGNSGCLASAELYDPVSNTWSAAGSLATARYQHTATLLSSGKVLVAGGCASSGGLASAQLYDPVSNTWSAAGSLANARYQHTATLLPSGKVLVAGGSGIQSSVELYDPASNTWSAAVRLVTGRVTHTATLLPSGKVLVAGGQGFSGYLTSAELYDPIFNTWSAAGSLVTGRNYHTATLLSTGIVLVAGGYGNSGFLASAELYDPVSNTWSATGSLATARQYHTATLLPSGKVLVDCGYGYGYPTTAELYGSVTNPPMVLSCPSNQTVEAVAAAGANVNYSPATATDIVTLVRLFSYSKSSTSTFPLGVTTVTVIAVDAIDNTTTGTFTVTVRDTTKPVVTPPPNLFVEATSAQGAIVANFGSVSATDAVTASPVITFAPAAGSIFALGVTTVTASATDAANNTGTATFTVTVRDTTKPVVIPPANIVVEATSAAGALVPGSSFGTASATDAVTPSSSLTITYNHAANTVFPIGITTVTASATDAANNTGTATFTVTVRDTTKPVVVPPANIVLEATSSAGALVPGSSFGTASATDAVTPSSSLTITYNHATTETFPIGVTTVTASATDAANNTGTATFTVTVRDTTKPVVTPPPNIVIEATSAQGAVVANFDTASATDAVTASPVITFAPAAGSTFALGVTTVTISARDAANNIGTATFTVTVRDTTKPDAPSNLIAEEYAAGPRQIILNWTNNANNAFAISVERHAPGGIFAVIASLPPSTTQWIDNTGLANGVAYTYRVQAIRLTSASDYSNEATVLPAGPINLSAAQITTGVHLSWQDFSILETGFVIERKSGTNGTYAQLATPNANARSFDDTTVLPNVIYYYHVKATNSLGSSAWSNEVCVPYKTLHIAYSNPTSATAPLQGTTATLLVSDGTPPSGVTWYVSILDNTGQLLTWYPNAGGIELHNLASGTYNLTVSAYDTASNAVSFNWIFTVQLPSAPLLFYTPADNGYLYNPDPKITGYASYHLQTPVDPDDLTITLIGTDPGHINHPVTISFDASGFNFTLVPLEVLPEDTYTVTAAVDDDLGNVIHTAVWHVKVDRTPPVISGLTPLPSSAINVPNPQISGIVQSAKGLNYLQTKLYLNNVDKSGNLIPITPNGLTLNSNGDVIRYNFIAAGLGSLPEGSYTILCEATDVAGNSSSAYTGFYIDMTAPEFYYINPSAIPAQLADGSSVNLLLDPMGIGATLGLTESGSGVAGVWGSDQNGHSVSLYYSNGVVGAYGLQSGNYNILVEAVDYAGNSSTFNWVFTADEAYTIITNTSIPVGIWTNNLWYYVSYTSGLPVVNSGVATTLTDAQGQSWPVIVTNYTNGFYAVPAGIIPGGTYTLHATVTDIAGLGSNSVDVSAKYDHSPPQFAYSNPPNATTPLQGTVASLQISDPPAPDGTPASGTNWNTVSVTNALGNNVPFSANGAGISVNVQGLPPGQTSLIVSATDNAGNSSSCSWSILIPGIFGVTVNDQAVPKYVKKGDVLVIKAADATPYAQVSLSVAGGSPNPANDGPHESNATVTITANQAGTDQITITATSDKNETQTYKITVVELSFLSVTEATSIGNSTYITPIALTGDVGILAVLNPDVGISDLPAYFVTWNGGSEGDDQLHRKVTRIVADSTDVTATCGNSQTVTIKVVGILSVTCESGATQTNVTGADNWASVKDNGTVVVKATIYPEIDAYNLPSDFITWDGGDAGDDQLHRNVPKDSSEKTVVTANCGSSDGHVNIWILWATIEIKTDGSTPGNAVQNGTDYDGTETLGPVVYDGGSKAAGKVVPIATITPEGVNSVVKSGWAFKREKMDHHFKDGAKDPSDWNENWTDDTSNASWTMLTPDNQDKIYDNDAPGINQHLCQSSYEVYNNYRQWVEWNGDHCSDYAYWYWQARFKLDQNPNITKKDVNTGQISLPDENSSHYK